MTAEQIYDFRPYTKADVNLIQSSWGHSYRKGSWRFKDIDPAEFHALHRPAREAILNRPTAAVIVCCSKADPDQIIGWICVEKPKRRAGMILHYIYVKKIYEGEGIASELMKRALKDGPVYYTQATKQWHDILDKNPERFEHYKFEPDLIRGETNDQE